ILSHEQVEQAVAVVVEDGDAAAAEGLGAGAALLRDVGEVALAVVAEELAAEDLVFRVGHAADVEVEVAVVVEVGEEAAGAAGGDAEDLLVFLVGGELALLVAEEEVGAGAGAVAGEGGDVEVEVAVVVDVAPGGAVALDLGDVGEEAGLVADVGEDEG